MYPNIRLTICSDSQGRDVAGEIESATGGQIKVFGYVRPNTTLLQIIDAADIEKVTPLVIIGGSNDSLNNSYLELYEHLETKLSRISKMRTVFLATIPTRYDKPQNHPVNIDLKAINNYIIELTARLNNVHLIHMEDFKRLDHTRHGLHLNKKGKIKLANTIIHNVSVWYAKSGVNQIAKPPEVYTGQCTEDGEESSSLTEVVDTHMDCLIEKHCSDKSVGFAHSISSDFESPKNMSAGVAVVFRKHFGRPAAVHRLETHLAQQRIKDGATVFSLITKDHYFGKPTTTNYDIAFKQLTKYFQDNGLTKLICSPIGCVRDIIDPKHFITNLKSFKKQTGAQIIISSYFQKSYKSLRSGLTHEDFNNRIKDIIANNIPSSIEKQNKQLSTAGPQIQSVLVPGEASYAEIVKEREDPVDRGTGEIAEMTAKLPPTSGVSNFASKLGLSSAAPHPQLNVKVVSGGLTLGETPKQSKSDRVANQVECSNSTLSTNNPSSPQSPAFSLNLVSQINSQIT